MNPTQPQQTILRFVAYLADGGLAHSTISAYLSGLRFVQIASGLPDPDLPAFPQLHYVLRGVHRCQSSLHNRRLYPSPQRQCSFSSQPGPLPDLPVTMTERCYGRPVVSGSSASCGRGNLLVVTHLLTRADRPTDHSIISHLLTDRLKYCACAISRVVALYVL